MTKNTRVVWIMGAVLLLGSAVLPAFADDGGACRDDVKKLCGDVKPGGGSIMDCMKAHESELSQGCKDNMAEGKKKMEDKMNAIKQACQADLGKFCANVTPGQGREFACLRAYDDKISAGCKAALPKPMMGMGMHKPGDMHHGPDKGDENQDQPEAPPSK